jgi:hypothetical protein
MKKTIPIALSMLLICGILVLNAGIVQAGNAAFTIQEAYGGGEVTVDGVWGAEEYPAEYAWIENLDGGNKYVYRMETDFTIFSMTWLLDFVQDTTDDSGDIWQICVGANTEGTTPQTDKNKIEITGHTTLKVYKGTGTGWEEMTGATVTWKDSMATGHWVLELQADKATLGDWGQNAPPEAMRVAMYDADTETWVQWPPASTADNPDTWGVIGDGYGESIPESISFGIVALLSTAVVAGAFVLSKRTKSANLALITHK